MRDGSLTSKQYAELASPADLMQREWAPCRYHCPVHADVRAYIEHAAAGRFGAAIDTIRDNLPFAAICGRICHHPCEANCRREDVDSALAIREVKRFVAELQGAKGSTVRKAAKQDKAKVAIIGAGPAGMAAALDLAKLGYRPTVFEKFPFAGGIPATAIPKYRLPREVIQIDIDWICAHGVELVTGVEIGKDKSIEQLKAEGFSAVLVAAGLAKSRMLPLPGADHPLVRPVLDFLQEISLTEKSAIGQDVLVIGGGNVAVDAARSALRLGAKRVRMMCLEAEAEMPAWEWERTEAREEGIDFINRRGPVEILVKSGKITGVKARKVTRVFDENKRFNPQYDDGDVTTVECDCVVMAIGQMADLGFARGSNVKADARGRVEFSPVTFQTSDPAVFACGEIVTPPGSAVEACASGQRAVKAIDLFLSGRAIRLSDELPPFIGKIAPAVGEKVRQVPRNKVATADAAGRKSSFEPVDFNYVEAAALCEARRCMGCGGGAEVLVDKCAGCLTCLRVCPFGIPKVADVATIDSALCQACGMCAAECPNNAIVSRSKPARDLATRTAAILKDKPGQVIAYICGQHASAEKWKAITEVPEVNEVYVTSTAGISVNDMLSALVNGASSLLVIACHEGADRYPNAVGRIRARVMQAKSLIQEAGLNGERIKLFELA